MVIESSEGGTLRAVLCAAADRVDLRTASRRVATLELPAGAPVVFRPKGNRLALSRLRQPLKLGGRVPLTLIIENAAGARQEIEVDAEVRRESPVDAELRAHRH